MNRNRKPYIFLELSDKEPAKDKPITHEKFEKLTGKLLLRMEVVSQYLFVGSGSYDFNPNAKNDEVDVWFTFYRRNGKVCIPGSSIKGAIRSIVEAISNSCFSVKNKEDRVRKSYRKCQDLNDLCPACRLFGLAGKRDSYKGRINFSDAIPERRLETRIIKIQELWSPKKSKENARKLYLNGDFSFQRDEKPERGARFVEVVPRGSIFKSRLFFENVKKSELGLIFHALGWQYENQSLSYTAFYPKIGGAKPRCLGAVKFIPIDLVLVDSSKIDSLFAPFILNGQKLDEFIKNALADSQRYLDITIWEGIRKALQFRNFKCPEGLY